MHGDKGSSYGTHRERVKREPLVNGWLLCQCPYNRLFIPTTNISSWFSSDSEAFASESLENHEEMLNAVELA